ncbi:hypothetical protein OHB26_07590 [Nocardia sp. NBC_01503]|uniref:DUF6636 domain-containing protein n=1 Tax=Nocardia sp. NBC_01503 TaxID=2975997 RepID=UPI002E7C5322|nr:DUF6636 domain-containing protein [Nocardia sp. NBC_01503]WTL34068.1 hypothetical protein OHB26_07590 [Nocardia sp. NBC_01503]
MKSQYFSTIAGALAIAGAVFGVNAGTANADSLDQFVTPSGNIGCLIGPQGATCQIREFSYVQPQRPGNCHGNYGDVFGVEPAVPGRITCHTDAPIDFHSRTVDYGHQVRQGNIVCTVSMRYVECVDATSGHGFRVAREFYAVY